MSLLHLKKAIPVKLSHACIFFFFLITVGKVAGSVSAKKSVAGSLDGCFSND
jgi:hypothetical protein